MRTRDEILKYAKEEHVFTVEEIAKRLAVPQKERRNLNKMLKRLCDSGKLHRYKRGMYGYEGYIERYGVVIHSHFPNDGAFSHLCLKDEGSYISGADFYNMIGLSTWIARKKVVVTNKVKRKVETDTAVVLPPKTFITKENKDYLQVLDCFENYGKLAIDHSNPYGLIMCYIREKGLDIQTLIAFAKRYYTKKTQENLIKCLTDDYFRK